MRKYTETNRQTGTNHPRILSMNDPRTQDWIDILLDEPDDDMLELDYEIYDDESNDLDLDYTTQQ